jgi:hypothetical protein
MASPLYGVLRLKVCFSPDLGLFKVKRNLCKNSLSAHECRTHLERIHFLATHCNYSLLGVGLTRFRTWSAHLEVHSQKRVVLRCNLWPLMG